MCRDVLISIYIIKTMKRTVFTLLLCTTFSLLFSSCAAIVGGAKYNARVRVPDHPNAKISINGQYRGNGEASMVIKRKEANMLNITVQEGDDEPQTTTFNDRKFRAGAFIFDLLLGWVPPIPVGIIVDGATGAWWKPDDKDPWITKIDGKNYLYTITYRPSTTKPNTTNPPVSVPIPQEPASDTISKPTIAPSITPSQPLTKTKAEALRELKQLLDEGILTQEEYEKEKAKLLESN